MLNILSRYLLSSALISTTRLQTSFWSSSCSSQLMATPYSISYVTVPNQEVAKNIAGKLVENQLAACVNIIPGVTSVYKWQGKIETDSELLLMIKTRTSRLEEMTQMVKTNHPYEVCEVISLPIQHGNVPYLNWIGDNVPEK